MTRNAWTIAGSLVSLAASFGACADAFPDGRLKHVLQVIGGSGALLLALRAHWPFPSQSINSVTVPRPEA